MNFLDTIIIAIVEGLTEYLPVSSTAHMVFASNLLGLKDTNFLKIFEICIQIGAIMAVVVLYYKKFFNFKRVLFYYKLIIAVIPALILGALLAHKISSLLENTLVIVLVLIIGGIVLLFVDKLFSNPTTLEEQDITIKQAFIIGIWQTIALIPGVSRSAASIIGGLQQNLSRKAAAEFSFFLAIPTMMAATAYSLFLKNWEEHGILLKGYQILLSSSAYYQSFILGLIIAFFVALIAIKTFITIVQNYGFRPWGWYRIIIGILLLFVLNFK